MTIKIPRLRFTFTPENLACLALFIFLTKSAIKTFMYYILRTPAEVNSWIAIVLMYIPVLVLLLSQTRRKAFLSFAGVWICVFLICMGTYLIHPEYKDWLFHGEFSIWLAIFRPDQALYLFLFIRLINDPKKLWNTLKWAGFILIAYNAYKLFYAEVVRGYWITTGIQRGAEGEYNLGFGYDVLLLFVLFTELGRRESKKFYILSAVALVCILLAGSRGPLLGVALILLLHLWERVRVKRMAQRVVWMGLAISIAVVVIVNMSTIVMGLGFLLQRTGVSSRTAMLLMSGNFADDSGRSTIYGIAIDLIKTGGPFGHGIYGDRYVIAQTTSLWIGYCHDIFLEILVDFGYLLGGIILVVMICRIIRIVKAPESDWRSLYIVFLIAASQLIFSGSLWYTASFWGAMALDFCWAEKAGKRGIDYSPTSLESFAMGSPIRAIYPYNRRGD